VHVIVNGSGGFDPRSPSGTQPKPVAKAIGQRQLVAFLRLTPGQAQLSVEAADGTVHDQATIPCQQ
jgi:hypothetical protein